MAPRGILLIAGPCRTEGTGTLAGAGAFAALAAAPLTAVQLWTRAGKGFAPRLRTLFEQRGIDLSGLDYEGPSPTADGADHDALGSLEPVRADDLTAILITGLPAADGDRALTVIERLPGADDALRIVQPCPQTCLGDPAHLERCAAIAHILVLPAPIASTALGADDPVTAARSLQEAGCPTVALSTGFCGGLLAYKQRLITWPATPRPDRAGAMTAAVFAGFLAGHLAQSGQADYRTLKRALATASAVAGTRLGSTAEGLPSGDAAAYRDLFNRLRRSARF